jgi:hypothetical protein
MILQDLKSVALQQIEVHNASVSSTRPQAAVIWNIRAQPQQVAPFFCYHSRLFSSRTTATRR